MKKMNTLVTDGSLFVGMIVSFFKFHIFGIEHIYFI